MKYAVCMPAYNEALGLSDFVREIADAFSVTDFHIFVVNDFSTDETSKVLANLQTDAVPITYRSNTRNLGHGPSTLEALQLGLESKAEFIIAVDGDGQFTGPDLFGLATELAESGADVLEGVRISRSEPLYRRITSLATRLLVFSRCGQLPPDANTPVRGYRAAALQELVQHLPAQVMTPNLFISALSRTLPLVVAQEGIRCYPRRGGEPSGTTWKARTQSLPSRRFLAFCSRATVQWLSPGQNGHRASSAQY